MKLGVQPDRILLPMLNDRMVAKGLILQYATAFFSDYLSTESVDDLVALLRKARLDDHLLDLFPPQKRTLKDFDEHFKVGALVRTKVVWKAMGDLICQDQNKILRVSWQEEEGSGGHFHVAQMVGSCCLLPVVYCGRQAGAHFTGASVVEMTLVMCA